MSGLCAEKRASGRLRQLVAILYRGECRLLMVAGCMFEVLAQIQGVSCTESVGFQGVQDFSVRGMCSKTQEFSLCYSIILHGVCNMYVIVCMHMCLCRNSGK